MEKLTESQEDYLEEIYIQVLKNGFAKVTDISNNLNVKKASVSGALNILQKRGLINYAPYSQITLTEYGLAQAQKILKRHKTLTGFFVEFLGLPEKSAVENACRIEHAITEELFEKAVDFYELLKNYAEKNSDFRELVDMLKK